MEFNIIIPNYNGENLLKENLPKLLRMVKTHKRAFPKDSVDISVVDDNSFDGSLVVLKDTQQKANEQDIHFTVVSNKENKGFAASCNNAVQISSGDIIILLNSDVYPENDFLLPLKEDFLDQSVFAVGFLDKSIEGNNIVERGSGRGFWKRGIFQHSEGDTNTSNTFWVSGGSGAFRKSIWEKIGGFDPIYKPFYWEDIDLSYRAKKMGYKVFFERRSVVVHKHEEGAIKKSFSNNTIKAVAYRNQFFFVWINITDDALLLNHLLWIPYYLVRAVLHIDIAFFIGLGQALLSFPQVLFSRRRVKKLSILKDKQILQ